MNNNDDFLKREYLAEKINNEIQKYDYFKKKVTGLQSKLISLNDLIYRPKSKRKAKK
jgi:hypothetical protein